VRTRTTVAAALVLVLVLVLALAGCGGSTPHSSRPAVAAYVKRVNKLESNLAAPLKAVTIAGSKLSSSTSSVNQLQETSLRRAVHRIVALRRRLGAIPTPASARPLRILVLLLASGEIDMTNELSRLFAFLPRYGNALRTLSPATAALRTELANKGSGTGNAGAKAVLDAKARALTKYRARLVALETTLRRLVPPQVARPQYQTELHALSGMQSSAAALAQGLQNASPKVSKLLAAFDRAAVTTQSLPAQRAEIAAVKSYDARVAKLNTLAAQVAEERLKLDQTLS
jgi:hypothetical protein